MSAATQERPRDRYDQEVERLTAEPELIGDSWVNAEPLFGFVRREGERGNFGCLTQIRDGSHGAPTPELTAAIRDDERLVKYNWCLTPDHLPIHAEWQRRIDQELGRTPPPMLPEPAP